MSESMKLTPAQFRELRLLAEEGRPLNYNPAFKPLVRLMSLGLVMLHKEGRFGSSTYVLTDAGRATFAERTSP